MGVQLAEARALLADVVAVMGWYDPVIVVPDQLADRVKSALEAK